LARHVERSGGRSSCLLTYLLEAGSDRIGGLDFQTRADVYEHRASGGTLEQMVIATAQFLAGDEVSPDLSDVVFVSPSPAT